MEEKKFEFKLKNVSLNVDNVEDIDFPALKDRTIMKFGDVVEFSMNDIEKNFLDFRKFKKEQEAQIAHQEAIMKNVEHFHPFVLEMSEQDLLTAWMYKEAKGNLEKYKKNLDKVDTAIAELESEVAQIKEQIPEFNQPEAETLPEETEEKENE